MNSKKIVFLALFLALSLILSYVESLIPFFFGIPGVKLGLANIIVVVLLIHIGAKEAIFINILRIILAGFMFGNAFSIIYSLAGGIFSFVIMLIAFRIFKLGLVPISVLGGIFHNVGQLIVACIVLETAYMSYYLPVLLLAGFATGLVTGIIANEVFKRVKGVL